MPGHKGLADEKWSVFALYTALVQLKWQIWIASKGNGGNIELNIATYTQGNKMLKSKTPHNFVLGTFAEGNYLLPWRPNCEASDLLPDLPTLSQVRFPNIIIIITIVIGTTITIITTVLSNLPEASFPNSVAIGTDCLILPPPTIYIFGSQKLSPAKVVEKTGQIMSLPFHCLERKTCQSKLKINL